MGVRQVALSTKHVILAFVEDKPGVLHRVSSLIRRRGFNIDTITVGATEVEGVSRITMTMTGDEKAVEQVVKQLAKLIDVVKISRLRPESAVVRELAMVKVHTPNSSARTDVMQFVEIFRGHVVDVSPESLTIELLGDPDKVDAFIDIMRRYGIKELARTGVVAMQREKASP
ncbi:MAG: acetolactate synthase small subunit [Candidatus Nezhaarchaeota archaeon]|nr:acetolactate synthase small subunit [Candidatus Nezhaarchaeota archaeon]